MAETQALDNEALVRRVVSLCHERRGEDIIALDVRKLVEYMDFLVIATGRSERQNKAIGDHVARQLKREGQAALSQAGTEEGAWICIDFVHVVLHVFTPQMRTHYDLELLWADADRVPIDAELTSAEEA
jgi:ribosome-associated protein